jgi:hypothetical protein
MPFTMGQFSFSLNQGSQTPQPLNPTMPFLQTPENRVLRWCLGWAQDELLFELVGLVLCLAAWAVTGCLLGQGGGLKKGPLVNR